MYNFPSAFSPIYFPKLIYLWIFFLYFFMHFCFIMHMRGLSFKVHHGVNYLRIRLIDIRVHGSIRFPPLVVVPASMYRCTPGICPGEKGAGLGVLLATKLDFSEAHCDPPKCDLMN